MKSKSGKERERDGALSRINGAKVGKGKGERE